MAENDSGATTTVNAPRRKKKRVRRTDSQPGGQTAEGSGELGGVDESRFAEPVTRLTNLGTATATEVEDDEKKAKKPAKAAVAVAHAFGLKRENVLGYNERTRVVVFDDGGKYQLSKDGKALRHLSGPKPPSDLNLDVLDARTRSPFTGTAAAINASVHELPPNDPDLLRARRAELQAELDAVNEELGDEEETDEEEE